MHYVLICTDKPDSLDLRMSVRPAHLGFLEKLGSRLKAAGPLLDENEKPNGSLLVIEASSQQEAERMAAQDPYALAGLFSSVELKPWKWLIKNPESV